MRRDEHIAIPGGELQFRKTARFDREIELGEHPDIRRLSAEQSNSSQIIDDIAVLKIVRKVLSRASIPKRRSRAI